MRKVPARLREQKSRTTSAGSERGVYTSPLRTPQVHPSGKHSPSRGPTSHSCPDGEEKGQDPRTEQGVFCWPYVRCLRRAFKGTIGAQGQLSLNHQQVPVSPWCVPEGPCRAPRIVEKDTAATAPVTPMSLMRGMSPNIALLLRMTPRPGYWDALSWVPWTETSSLTMTLH